MLHFTLFSFVTQRFKHMFRYWFREERVWSGTATCSMSQKTSVQLIWSSVIYLSLWTRNSTHRKNRICLNWRFPLPSVSISEYIMDESLMPFQSMNQSHFFEIDFNAIKTPPSFWYFLCSLCVGALPFPTLFGSSSGSERDFESEPCTK